VSFNKPGVDVWKNPWEESGRRFAIDLGERDEEVARRKWRSIGASWKESCGGVEKLIGGDLGRDFAEQICR